MVEKSVLLIDIPVKVYLFSWRIMVLFDHFRLPTHNNLKNLKNNFCVHPNGGWPGEGVQLVYWPGCGEERLKLNFFELGKTNFSDP